MLRQQSSHKSKQRVVRFEPTPKQHQAWILLSQKIIRELVFGGGAGGGKTTFGCAWLTINALQYPGTRYIIGRKELKRLKQSVLLTLLDLFAKWGLQPKQDYFYNSQESKLHFSNSSEFHLMDLDRLPSDPNYERLGSIEYTYAFLEEAGELEQKAKEVVSSRLRYKLKEYDLTPKTLITCNPSKNWLYNDFYRPFKDNTLPNEKAFIQSLVTDNPHISPYYIESLRNLKDRVLRERLLNGNWEYEDSDTALFEYDGLTDMFTGKIQQEDKTKYITVDAARFGNDKAVIFLWEGFKLINKWVYPKSALDTLGSEIQRIAKLYAVPMSRVVVDEDGIGGGIVDYIKCKGFVGGSTPIDRRTDAEKESKTEYKINYRNLRAQCYHTAAEKVNAREVEVAIGDDLDFKNDLIQELEQIQFVNIDRDSKLQIVSKEDIKLNIGRSPDYADTFMMRMWFDVNPEKKKARGFLHKPAGW